MRHFIDLKELDGPTLRNILNAACYRKGLRTSLSRGVIDDDSPLKGKILAMLFQKPSTRTRVSFDVAMRQLGGQTLILNAGEMQLDRGESIGDTVRVLSNYVDILMVRSLSHNMLEEMVNFASVPVINGLTDRSHPCQIMADLMTYEEYRGSVVGKHFAWCGDGNNVAATWAQASAKFGFRLSIASPQELTLDKTSVDWVNSNGGAVSLTLDPVEAVSNADCVLTDVWVSMADEQNLVMTKDLKHALLKPYRVTSELMAKASDKALFMHCLPAHRDQEVDSEVIEGNQSVVWSEAENRVHVQKSILTWCFEL